jgi:hypothetical protein
MTTILTKKKDTTGAPAPGDLTNGAGGAELAVNTADKRLYTKDSGGSIVEVGIDPATFSVNSAYSFPTSDGTTGQVLTTNGSGTLSFASSTVGTVTSVEVSGGTTGLTTSGGPITSSGTITLAGTLAVANGGTGNNAASSGKVYKINSIIVANVDGSAAADITIKIFSEDDLGGTGTAIASTISVPADASLVVIDKTTSFYLLEDQVPRSHR